MGLISRLEQLERIECIESVETALKGGECARPDDALGVCDFPPPRRAVRLAVVERGATARICWTTGRWACGAYAVLSPPICILGNR